MWTRRAAFAALAGLAAMRGARAQGFPSRTVTIVVPYPAGGPVDAVARLIAHGAAPDLGQSIAVDNRSGGAGVIGSSRSPAPSPTATCWCSAPTRPTPPTRAC